MSTSTAAPTASRLSLGDRMKRWSYLQWVDTWLSSLPRRRRKEVLAELHQNLGTAAAEVGMPAAIDELGSPRLLASRYLEAEPRQGPRWISGAIAAAVVFGIWLYATAVYVFGALDALGRAGVEHEVSLRFLGVEATVENSSSTMAAQFTEWSWPTVVAMLLAFALFSRIWRLRHRRG